MGQDVHKRINTRSVEAALEDLRVACEQRGYERGLEDGKRLAELAVRPAIPEGWVLVPLEPTSNMRYEGGMAQERSLGSYGEPAVVYRAMLAAAPEPAEGE